METRKKARNTLVGNFTFLMTFSDVYLCYLFKVSLLLLKKTIYKKYGIISQTQLSSAFCYRLQRH